MQPIDAALLMTLVGGTLLALWILLLPQKGRPGDSLAGGEGFIGPTARKAPRRPLRRAGKVVGVVRAFREYTETERSNFYPERTIIVWNFYVERYVGNHREMSIPVQMRGVSFSSSVADGDDVELSLGWGLRKGGTARPRSVMNRTSGARVIACYDRTLMESLIALGNVVELVLGVLFFVMILVVLIAGVVWLVSTRQVPGLNFHGSQAPVKRVVQPK
jgi:hypothetical protein